MHIHATHNSRLTQLLLSKERRKPNTNRNLAQQAQPETRRAKSGSPERKIREYSPRPSVIRCRETCENRSDRAEDLCGNERESDVEARHGLEEDHAEANTLQGIEDAEPEPETAA